MDRLRSLQEMSLSLMKKLPKAILCAVALAAFCSLPVQAGSETDHPLLSGISGAAISSKNVLQFGVEDVPYVAGEYRPGARRGPYEGRVTTIDYTASPPIGEVKIHRNYLAAVQKMGGQQLNTGFDPNDTVSLVTGPHVFTLGAGPTAPIALLNITSGYGYQLKIIEPQKMEQSVTAGALVKEITAKGYATLYINFDTNKSDLKNDGIEAVKQIVQLMKDDANLKLSIEGHTDNIGAAAANKALSRDRAASVMRAVIAQGIDGKRLGARGLGAEVPVADNRTEEGRAKNRRVELVKIK